MRQAALMGLAMLGGLVACTPVREPPPEPQTLQTLQEQRVYIGDGMPLRDNEAALIAAYERVERDSHEPQLRRRATQRLATLEVEGAISLPSPQGREYQQAVERYRALLEGDVGADAESLLYRLARAYAQQGRDTEAYTAMGELLSRFPDSPNAVELHFRRGEYRFSHADYRGAETEYRAVLADGELGFFNEKALYKLGWSQHRQHHYQAAVETFMRLVRRKLTPQLLEQAPPLEQLPLGRGDRELVADVIRGASLSLVLGERAPAAALPDGGPYHYLLIEGMLEWYRQRNRYNDAVATARSFVSEHPRHPAAPRLQLQLLDIARQSGFRQLLFRERAAFVERYHKNGEHWHLLSPAHRQLLTAPLQKAMVRLAQVTHARAQRSGRDEDFHQAQRWYRHYLDAFPQGPQAAKMNFLLAESLYENAQYDEAVSAYERSAYHYRDGQYGADAGYTALLAYRKHEAGLEPGEFRDRWHWLAVSSALNFVRQYGDDPRAPRILANAAEELYALHKYQRAADTARLLLLRSPGAEKAVLLTTWTVLGYSEFELGRFAEAEKAYREVLALSDQRDPMHAQRIEWLAAAIYKQAEQARANGYPETAARHFLRVGKMAAGAEIRVTADYDAAASMIAAENWEGAIPLLQGFRRRYPDNPLLTDISAKLAVAYMRAGHKRKAAEEFEQLAERQADPQAKREALWLAAKMYGELQQGAQQRRVYRRYLKLFPTPLERAMEVRQRLVELAERDGDAAARKHWLQELVRANAEHPGEQNVRTRYLAATAQLTLAEPLFERFAAIPLKLPLERSLQRKKQALERALKAYERVLDLAVAETVTQASFRIAELHRLFGRALLDSDRPAELNEEELAQYELLLEEQAYPFEENAIRAHAANLARIPEGLYDEWTRKSLEQLRQLRPARYAKDEEVREVFSVLR